MSTNTNKVYAPHVTAQQMSIDGWSRDFDVSQTVEEMRAMGVDITPEQVQKHWDTLSTGYVLTELGL